MIDIEEALRLSRMAFPKGPEALCEHLGIPIERTALSGSCGWCVRSVSETLIRVNSRQPQVRQRFTLAHEVAHLLLGTDPHVQSETFGDYASEEATNQVASELLLPSDVVKRALGASLPVDSETLRKLHNDANVSWMVAARKIARMSRNLGLYSAFVAQFHQDGGMEWMWPRDAVRKALAELFWDTCGEGRQETCDLDQKDGSTVRLITHVTEYSRCILAQKTIS